MKRLPAVLAGLWARFVVLEEQRAMVETSVTACERVREYCLGVSEQLAEMDDACKRDLMARLRRESAGGRSGGRRSRQRLTWICGSWPLLPDWVATGRLVCV